MTLPVELHYLAALIAVLGGLAVLAVILIAWAIIDAIWGLRK